MSIKTKFKNKNNLPWFNENLWKLMKTRNAALRKAIKTRRETDMLFYKGLRNKVIQELRLAKSCFYVNILNEAKGNNKLIWENTDNLTRRSPKSTGDLILKVQGELIEDNCLVASALNNFFLESVCELAKKISNKETGYCSTRYNSSDLRTGRNKCVTSTKKHQLSEKLQI